MYLYQNLGIEGSGNLRLGLVGSSLYQRRVGKDILKGLFQRDLSVGFFKRGNKYTYHWLSCPWKGIAEERRSTSILEEIRQYCCLANSKKFCDR